MYLNEIKIIGRLGKVPEYKQGIRSRLSFSVCTSRKFRKQDGSYSEVKDWHLVTAWGKLADNIAGFRLPPGCPVFVNGEMHYSQYQAKDGSNKVKAEIVASDIQVLANRSETESLAKSQPQQEQQPQQEEYGEDNLPF